MTAFAIDVPRIPAGDWVEDFFDALTDNLEGFFDGLTDVGNAAVDGLISALQAPDPVITALIFTGLALLVRGWKVAAFALVGLLFVISLEQWDAAMQTLGLVLVATVISVLIGVPLGVLAARSRRASAVLRPIMDLMQTMPAMVWLVPAVAMFSIGVVPGVFATVIFALPPGLRLTELGIRNVDAEVVEAAEAFGATPGQTLFGVQLPLALPTIMAGVNQVIMLALSMAVIAGLVGAEGLGGQVTEAVATLDIGLGFEAGLSVVILAIYLDRVTAAVGQGGGLSVLRRTKRTSVRQDQERADDGVSAEEPAAVIETPTKIGA